MVKKAATQHGNYAFIDSQNVVASLQKLGWKMDWRKFRQFLASKHGVSHAYMFIGYMPEYHDMYEQMHDAGYLVVLKPTFDLTRPRQDESGKEIHYKKPVKGNIDADLVLWVMRYIDRYKKAVIVSGDGDFYGVVEYLIDRDKLDKLLAPSGYYSSLFNRYKDHVERLDQHRADLEYHDRKKKGRQKGAN